MSDTQSEKRQTVEDALILDVDLLAREGSLTPGVLAMAIWRRGTTVTGIGMWRIHENIMRVSYTPASPSTGQEIAQNEIPIIRRPAGFGGERASFTCPGCKAPVRKLYLPASRRVFACRACHHLGYRSQRKSRYLRLRDRVDALCWAMAAPWLSDAERAEAAEELQGVLPAMNHADPLPRISARIDRLLSPQPPRRPPGRPSKRELQERARAARLATQPTEAMRRPRGRAEGQAPLRAAQAVHAPAITLDQALYRFVARSRHNARGSVRLIPLLALWVCSCGMC